MSIGRAPPGVVRICDASAGLLISRSSLLDVGGSASVSLKTWWCLCCCFGLSFPARPPGLRSLHGPRWTSQAFSKRRSPGQTALEGLGVVPRDAPLGGRGPGRPGGGWGRARGKDRAKGPEPDGSGNQVATKMAAAPRAGGRQPTSPQKSSPAGPIFGSWSHTWSR